MIPAALLKVLPATVAEIQEFAGLANDLRSLRRKFTHPFDFINDYLREHPGTSRKQAGLFYRIGTFFYNEAQYLQYYSPTDVIDRRLASVGTVPLDKYDATRPYRYAVDITATSPKTGRSKTYTIYVPTRYLLTVEDAIGSALLALAGRMEAVYSAHVDSATEEAWRGTAKIVQFTRFEIG